MRSAYKLLSVPRRFVRQKAHRLSQRGVTVKGRQNGSSRRPEDRRLQDRRTKATVRFQT